MGSNVDFQAQPNQRGHLTSHEKMLFVDLKEKALNAMPGSEGQTWYDDSTLLRYLRARGWDVDKAIKQLLATDAWRTEKGVDNLYATMDVEEFERAKQICPKWCGRRDKLGRPVFFYKLSDATCAENIQELALTPAQRQIDQMIALSEIGERYLFELCSSLDDRVAKDPNQIGMTVTSTTGVIDFQGSSYLSIWGLRHLMQIATQISSEHHPETAYLIFVVNAPSFFAVLWKWVKGWMDEGTRKKFFILSKAEMKETLARFIHVKDLPKAYGGELEWTYQDEPLLDEPLQAALGGAKYPPRGPWTWKEGTTTLLGSVNGEPRGESINGSDDPPREREETACI